MPTLHRFVPQFYRDSVSLMQFSQGLKARPGVDVASAVMATEANLALLRESGVLTLTLEPRPDDLMLVLGGPGVTDDLLATAEEELRRPTAAGTGGSTEIAAAGSIVEAKVRETELNFALISVPGDYAAAEGLKALASGLHAMLFSDNVSVENEVFLKDEAARRGLLLLGPDCGTAIVNGVPLGFANQVRRGNIGVVSASGTGLQEVTSLLDRWGSGVSQALGIGGRDLKDAVGGRAALACIDVLEADPATKVLVLVSKPPGAAVRPRLDARLAQCRKPVVACYVGDPASPTLGEAARLAFRFAEGRSPDDRDPADLPPVPVPQRAGGKWLRALYSGGTLCAEAAFLAASQWPDVRSNVSVPGVKKLDDPWLSVGHCLVDLGEDEFTRGRPHPMIDQTLRLDRLATEAADPETAALLVDVVLGHGAHSDPATELAAALKGLPPRSSGRVPVFASVTGTEADPQNWSRSLATLRQAGIAAFGNHLEAVRAALNFVATLEEKS